MYLNTEQGYPGSVKLLAGLWWTKSEPPHDKPTKRPVRPAKTLIRLGGCRMKRAWILSYPLSAQRLLWSDWADAAWRELGFLATHWAHSEDSDHWADAAWRELGFLATHWAHSEDWSGFVTRRMDGWVRVLHPFNSISVISRRWKGEHERLCAMKRRLGLGRISPPAGFEPATPWSQVGSANCSATRTLHCHEAAQVINSIILPREASGYKRLVHYSQISNMFCLQS